MSAKKKSLLTSAERHMKNGKWKRAISDYTKLSKLEPDNIHTQLKLGELYIKSGQIAAAKHALLQTSSHYEESGMVLKAIAVYNQVIQFDPGDPEIRLLLANAYKRIGLANDAAFQFGLAIKGFEGSKNLLQKLETIRTLLELDPENLSTRIRLAEEYSRNGMIDEAAEQFQSTCDTLLDRGMVEEFAQVAERLLFHKPDAFDTAKVLARYYLTKDYPQRALPLLHGCYKKHKEDVEVLNLLAHSFQRLGQVHKAVVVLGQLRTVYTRSGLQNEESEITQRIISLDPEHALAKEAKVNHVIPGASELDNLPQENSEPEASQVSSPSPIQESGAIPHTGTETSPPPAPEVQVENPVVIAMPTAEFEAVSLEQEGPPASPVPQSIPEGGGGPTIVFEMEDQFLDLAEPDPQEDSSPEFPPPPIPPPPTMNIPEIQVQSEESLEGPTIEFDMTEAQQTAEPIPRTGPAPPQQPVEPIASRVASTEAQQKQDNLITSDFEVPPHMFESTLPDGDDSLSAPTLVDMDAPEIEFEPEFEVQIPEPKSFGRTHQGELLEVDFFLEAGLLSDAQSLLEELMKAHGPQPELESRWNTLREKQTSSPA